MKYYLIAGEASGDLHGSRLVRALRQRDPQAEIRAWGGDLMEAEGAQVVKHYRDLAFMGFWEVITHLRTIFRNLDACKADIAAFQPDVLILIDYPGFNLRIAAWAKKAGFKTGYYISPQLWAWKEGRVKQIRAYVDRLFVILPFETAFYAKHGIEAEFVGHPLLDIIPEWPQQVDLRQEQGLDERPIIALLPGSRKQEIRTMLGGMLQMVPRFPHYQFVIAGAPAQEAPFYAELAARAGFDLQAAGSPVRLIRNRTYDLLKHASAALVTSGTATLETALFQVPEVVCYKGSPISYWIARRLVHVKYISLVNLILDAPLLTELIQEDFNPGRLELELRAVLSDPVRRQTVESGYRELRDKLGQAGAAERVAAGLADLAGTAPGH